MKKQTKIIIWVYAIIFLIMCVITYELKTNEYWTIPKNMLPTYKAALDGDINAEIAIANYYDPTVGFCCGSTCAPSGNSAWIARKWYAKAHRWKEIDSMMQMYRKTDKKALPRSNKEVQKKITYHKEEMTPFEKELAIRNAEKYELNPECRFESLNKGEFVFLEDHIKLLEQREYSGGVRYAKQDLIQCYRFGCCGVQKDLSKAYAWYESMKPDAGAYYHEMQEMLEEMTPEEIEIGKKLAVEYTNKYTDFEYWKSSGWVFKDNEWVESWALEQ